MTNTPKLDFGKFRGMALAEVPTWYIRSLAYGYDGRPPNKNWETAALAELALRANEPEKTTPDARRPMPKNVGSGLYASVGRVELLEQRVRALENLLKAAGMSVEEPPAESKPIEPNRDIPYDEDDILF